MEIKILSKSRYQSTIPNLSVRKPHRIINSRGKQYLGEPVCLFRNLLSFSLIFIVTLGCFSFQKEFPEKKTYLLEASLDSTRMAGARPNKKDLSLQIKKIGISRKYDGKSFIYRKSDANFEADFYNEFLIPPQSNIGEELVKNLDRSGLFLSVTDSSSRSASLYYLEVDVRSLYGDFRTSEKGYSAVMDIQVRLIADAPEGTRLLWSRNYSEKQKLSEESPESLVLGWNTCLTKIIERLSKDLYTTSFL